MSVRSNAWSLARAGVVAACLSVVPVLACASLVRISPLGINLSPDHRAATMTLQNEADTPVSLQVRVFAWQQGEAGMLLAPTTDVVAGPAMVTLAPGATQLIRVLARNPGDGTERAYRVLVDELPSISTASRGQVQVLTRYSLPLFLEPRVAGLPRVSLAWKHCADGRQFILLANTGERRIRLADWRLLDGTQVLATQPGLAGYVLAGSTLALPLPATLSLPERAVRLEAGTDLGAWQADVSPHSEPAACPLPADPS